MDARSAEPPAAGTSEPQRRGVFFDGEEGRAPGLIGQGLDATPQAVVRERRAEEVAEQALAALVVVRLHSHLGVEV